MDPPVRLRFQNLGVADFVLATAAIAQDWMSAMAYERALAALAQLPVAKLDPGSKAIVTRMEADIHSWYGPSLRMPVTVPMSPSTSTTADADLFPCMCVQHG